MHTLATDVITQAALAAGLPEGRVYDVARKDNITQKRPRVEIQFLPEKHTRTGRMLGITRTQTEQVRKKELYAVELTVLANVFAESEQWLSGFCYAFMAALPRGRNDSRGNWVRIRSAKAQFVHTPPPRVGEKSIEPMKRFNQIFSLTFTGRVTSEDREALIETFTIEPRIGGKHGQEG